MTRPATPARWRMAVAGYVAARAALRVARGGSGSNTRLNYTAANLARLNYRGRAVSLAGGPALAIAASATAAWGAARAGRGDVAAASLVAGLAAGAVGRLDDVAGGSGQAAAKGLRGHLGALRHGQVTTGVVKLVGLTLAGGLAAALLSGRRAPGAGRAVETILGAGLIAGSANLVNLFDLRPGRALKAALVLSAPMLSSRAGVAVAGPLGAAVAVLPDDLSERVMLGDCGANALGAVLGVAVAARTGIVGRVVALAAVSGLTLASERWSFSTVIESSPFLRYLDRLGSSARSW